MSDWAEHEPVLVVQEDGRRYERPFGAPTTGRRFEAVWVRHASSTYPMLHARRRQVVESLRQRLVPGARLIEGTLPDDYEPLRR